MFGGCGSPYDDCSASKTCTPLGTGGTGGSSGATSGSGTGGGAGRAFAGAGEGGMENPAGGRAGSSSTGGNDAGAGQGGEAGTDAGGTPDAGGAPGSAGAGTGGEAGTSTAPLPDTEPPYVVEVSPPDGALGVRADADIIVTFSEPMHRVETEKAYGSLDLPTKDVTFLWSEGDRELTIHADDGLEYGINPGGAGPPDPRTYTYLIANEARDVAGNRLEEDFAASFTTLREYTRLLSVSQASLLTRSELGTDAVLDACGEGETSAIIGEYFSGGGKLPLVGEGRGLLLSFQLWSGTRPTAPEDFFAAELSFESNLESIALGSLVVERLEVAKDPTWDTPVLETLVSTRVGSTRTADVRPAMLDVLFEHTSNTLRVFIHYELMLTEDGTTQTSAITCGDTSRIVVNYLAP